MKGPTRTSRDPITNYRNRQEATTIDTLDTYQLRELLAIFGNPRHVMIASRAKLFRRLDLIHPTEPPRKPQETQSRRAPPGRAHVLTVAALEILGRHGMLPAAQTEAAP